MSVRSIVITGASAGVGRALAVRASRAGYAVLATGRSAAALDTLATQIASEGGVAHVVPAELTEPSSAMRIVATALERFGRIDVLVNNAGEVAAGALMAQSDAALERQFRTHVIAPLALVREAFPSLRASHGQVFMLGSGVARVPVGGLGAYPASKAALRSATAALRRELKPDGVAVTYVDPGAIDTSFMQRAGMPGAPKRFLVSPEIVARAILRACATRPREVNAVPYQTALVALAERLPRATDALLERFPALVGGVPASDASDHPQAVVTLGEPTLAIAEVAPLVHAEAATVATALEPLARRMARLNLPLEFIERAMTPGAILETGELAMRWAGMPNKNERALISDVLAALAQAGYLEPIDATHWSVVASG